MDLHSYHTADAMEQALSAAIATSLAAAIADRGRAGMLVSGGSSPIGVFGRLSREDIPWNMIQVGLVDERFVSPGHEKSNELLVRRHLLVNRAGHADFTGMVYQPGARNANLETARKAYRIFAGNLDVVLLGMGLDGHTASLFPGDPESANGLSDDCDEILVNTTAPVEPTERISATANFIKKSNHLFLLISGAEKMSVLKAARQRALPIASFMNDDLAVYHWEK